jgi:RNA polymerase sigma factor (sigma-70 family)
MQDANARNGPMWKQSLEVDAPNKHQRRPEQPIGNHAQVDWARALPQHERWLRTVILSRVQEYQAVDEVLQEVSLVAVRQAAPLADVAKVAPWLYRIAVTQSLLYRRKMGRRRKLNERFAENGAPTEHDNRNADPLVWLLSEERQRMVRVALQRLKHRDRELLLLKYTENWNYHQIAEHLGISHSAIESRLHRARAKLRDELTQLQVIETSC